MGAEEVGLERAQPAEPLLTEVALELWLLVHLHVVLQGVLGAALFGADLTDELLKGTKTKQLAQVCLCAKEVGLERA